MKATLRNCIIRQITEPENGFLQLVAVWQLIFSQAMYVCGRLKYIQSVKILLIHTHWYFILEVSLCRAPQLIL